MSSFDSSRLWKEIVAATSDMGSDVTALRIPLWVTLQRPRPSVLGQAKDFLKAAVQFYSFGRATSPAPLKGGLLFCFPFSSPSNMNNLLPVAREALRRGLLGGIVTGGDYSSHLSEFAGTVPIISIQQLVGSLGMRERSRNLAQIIRVHRSLKNAISKRSPLLASSLTANRGAIVRALAESVHFGSVFERLLERWSPSCVVSSSDFWPLEHQLCCLASRRQIFSVVIQHGTISDFWWPFVADVYCMWSDTNAGEMRRLGTPPERLAVVGMPATDEIFKRAKSLQERHNEDGRQSVCLILSHAHGRFFEPAVFEDYRQFLNKAIRLTPSVAWKVKLHPAEDDSFYRSLDGSVLDRLMFYPKQISLQEAVADADVVTTVYSTAGLEAMVMDRPLIVAPLTPRVREFSPWPAAGGGTYASSAEDFRIQFSKLVSDPDFRSRQVERQREYLASHFANPGYAAKHIVDLLERYSHQHSSCSASSVPAGTLTVNR